MLHFSWIFRIYHFYIRVFFRVDWSFKITKVLSRRSKAQLPSTIFWLWNIWNWLCTLSNVSFSRIKNFLTLFFYMLEKGSLSLFCFVFNHNTHMLLFSEILLFIILEILRIFVIADDKPPTCGVAEANPGYSKYDLIVRFVEVTTGWLK